MQKNFYLGLKTNSIWVPEKFLSGSQKNFYLGLGKNSIWVDHFYLGRKKIFKKISIWFDVAAGRVLSGI